VVKSAGRVFFCREVPGSPPPNGRFPSDRVAFCPKLVCGALFPPPIASVLIVLLVVGLLIKSRHSPWVLRNHRAPSAAPSTAHHAGNLAWLKCFPVFPFLLDNFLPPIMRKSASSGGFHLWLSFRFYAKPTSLSRAFFFSEPTSEAACSGRSPPPQAPGSIYQLPPSLFGRSQGVNPLGTSSVPPFRF